MTQLLKVQSLTVTSDGYGAGEGQSLEAPFGHISPSELFAWRLPTSVGPMGGFEEVSRGLDDLMARDMANGIGAEIMGRNKFSPFRGPWNEHSWDGWWGDVPPFRTPVFVWTHYEREDLVLADTTFHFVSGTAHEVAAMARQAAGELDVRIGGGVSTVRAFLEADLIDTLHVVVSPLTAGRGEQLWSSPDDLLDRYHRETAISAQGTVHHLFWRR